MKRVIHQDIYGMSRVGFTSDQYEVYVNTDDGGNLPHFHYRKKDDWDAFHSCILIESPEYFAHGGEEDILNAKQRMQLQKFLESKNKRLNISNWEYLCGLWDDNNYNIEVSETATQPDYTKLK